MATIGHKLVTNRITISGQKWLKTTKYISAITLKMAAQHEATIASAEGDD